jgi:hypothetical protein
MVKKRYHHFNASCYQVSSVVIIPSLIVIFKTMSLDTRRIGAAGHCAYQPLPEWWNTHGKGLF